MGLAVTVEPREGKYRTMLQFTTFWTFTNECTNAKDKDPTCAN